MREPTETGVAELRQNLRQHLRQAADGRPVVITHEGYPQAVLVSVDQWRRINELADDGQP